MFSLSFMRHLIFLNSFRCVLRWVLRQTQMMRKKTKQKEKRRQRVREKPTPPSNPEFIVGMNNAFQCVHKRNLWELICFT